MHNLIITYNRNKTFHKCIIYFPEQKFFYFMYKLFWIENKMDYLKYEGVPTLIEKLSMLRYR